MEDYRLPAGAVGSLKALSLSGFPVWSVQQGEENTILTVTWKNSPPKQYSKKSTLKKSARSRYPSKVSRGGSKKPNQTKKTPPPTVETIPASTPAIIQLATPMYVTPEPSPVTEPLRSPKPSPTTSPPKKKKTTKKKKKSQPTPEPEKSRPPTPEDDDTIYDNDILSKHRLIKIYHDRQRDGNLVLYQMKTSKQPDREPSIFVLDMNNKDVDIRYFKPPGSKYYEATKKEWDFLTESANIWTMERCQMQMLWSTEEYFRLLHQRPVARTRDTCT